jgi:hypothetical protein
MDLAEVRIDSSCSPLFLQLIFDVIPQCDCIVVLTVVGTVKKSNGSPVGSRDNGLDRIRIGTQFTKVPLSEIAPLLWIMNNQRRKLLLGAASFSHACIWTSVFFMPRGHNRSTRKRAPSSEATVRKPALV